MLTEVPLPMQPRYDVAISFLAKDERLAAALNDALSQALRVFFFPRSQEDLAGTDGLESMRTPFLTDSRITVILFREPWGRTPWTRVEESAIKDACLNRGWTSLFFIALDNTSDLPIWLPQTLVRFNLSDYGIEQAAGAIKARVQDAGGKIEPPSAMADAKRIQQEAQFLADRERLFRDQRWITETVIPSIKALFAAMERVSKQVRQATGISYREAANDGRCVMTNNRVSLEVGWRQIYTNVVSDIIASEYNKQIALPGEHPLMHWHEPVPMVEHRFKPTLSLTRELCWLNETRPAQLLSSDDLADKCVRLFIDLLGRANRGEIDFSETAFSRPRYSYDPDDDSFDE